MKKMSTGEGLFFLAYIFVVLLPSAALWSAFVLTKLWAWFVVSTFGVPALSISAAAGISVLLSMFRPTPKSEKEDSDESVGWRMFALTFKVSMQPLFALALGYIIKVLS